MWLPFTDVGFQTKFFLGPIPPEVCEVGYKIVTLVVMSIM